MQRVRRGHELRLVLLGSNSVPKVPRGDGKLVALLAEAQQARTLIMTSPGQTISSIAKANGKCRKRLMQLLRISWLAPDLVGAIVKGVAPAGLTPARLLEVQLPACWSAQREMLSLI